MSHFSIVSTVEKTGGGVTIISGRPRRTNADAAIGNLLALPTLASREVADAAGAAARAGRVLQLRADGLHPAGDAHPVTAM